MKLIILIVLVVLVLGGGGGAGWYFLFREPPQETAAPEIPPDPVFLELDTLNVNIIRGGGVKKYVVFNITLEMRDEEAKALAEQKMPKLRDVYLGELNEYFANLPSTTQAVNVGRVKQRLLRASARALGKERVKDVLIRSVFERDWKAAG